MNIAVGIDAISFSTSKYFITLKELAFHRNVDYAKYCDGIGQKKMSVFPPNEDIVTIAIDAAQKALSNVEDKNSIDLLVFATESSFDLSKSAGIYVHRFLGLRHDCRVFDIKQACYSATAALHIAKSFIVDNPGSKALIIGSDIVKYPPGSSGEPTQGGAAVAIVMSENAKILEIEPYSGIHTEDIMDFWRPAKSDEAMFDGKLSAYNYLKSMDFSLNRYLKKSKLRASDINYACFHAPFGKMATKAAKQIFPHKNISDTLIYNEVIGNSCSASLYVCLLSLLENTKENMSRKRIGLYSYGSGSVAEYFSGIVIDEYRGSLFSLNHAKMLDDRIEISFDEYEKFCNHQFCIKNFYKNIGGVKLIDIEKGKRIYARINS